MVSTWDIAFVFTVLLIVGGLCFVPGVIMGKRVFRLREKDSPIRHRVRSGTCIKCGMAGRMYDAVVSHADGHKAGESIYDEPVCLCRRHAEILTAQLHTLLHLNAGRMMRA